MEEGAIKNPEEVKMTEARSEAFTSSHPQSASSGQDITEHKFSSFQLFLTADMDGEVGATPQELPDVPGGAGFQAKGTLFVNKYDKTRRKEKMTRARSEAFTWSHPQGTSSGQDINEHKLSSFQSFLTEDMDDDMMMVGAAPQEIQDVPNFDYDRSTSDRQVYNAGDDRVVGAAAQEIPNVPNFEDELKGAAPQEIPNVPNFEDELVRIDVPEPSSSKTNEGKKILDVDRDVRSGLLRAAYKGDWPAAKAVLDAHPKWIRFHITKEQDTVLHNAVSAKHTTFVTELVKLMTPADLEMESIDKFTALHVAAETGIVTMAKQMVERNQKLLVKRNKQGLKPLLIAAFLRHREMVSYLLSVTTFEWLTIDEHIELLIATISAGFYDIALNILENDPYLATAENTGKGIKCWWRALKELAIGNESQLSFCKRRSNSWFKGICTKALTQSTLAHQLVEEIWKKVGYQFSSNLPPNDYMTLLFEAAKVGNIDFLIILARTYPDLLWQVDNKKMSLFHIAVLYRQESVFNLIYEIGNNKNSLVSYTTSETENMLHLAGKLAPPDRLNIVSGAALQMQRELLWFKEIEKIMPPLYVKRKNSKGKTPKEIFIETHQDLQKEGEKWMKDTANYCMLVATLIATVIFAAAFTVPGGSNQETGTPIFLRSNWFMVFFISDAIALCSSSTSIVIFLSILTSRYTEKDFFKSLPSKLVFGLATLFISMAGMMLAFCATCFLVYNSARAWVPVVVITSASIPVTLFVLLHHKLWVDTVLSTYKSKFLFGPYKRKLF